MRQAIRELWKGKKNRQFNVKITGTAYDLIDERLAQMKLSKNQFLELLGRGVIVYYIKVTSLSALLREIDLEKLSDASGIKLRRVEELAQGAQVTEAELCLLEIPLGIPLENLLSLLESK